MTVVWALLIVVGLAMVAVAVWPRRRPEPPSDGDKTEGA